jgi:hypothetical protein
MDFDVINFSNCCMKARRIVIDYEDKGWIDLLDMDRVICGEQVIDIRDCRDCPDHTMQSEEGVGDGLIRTWLDHSVFWRMHNEDNGHERNRPEDNQERNTALSELPE